MMAQRGLASNAQASDASSLYVETVGNGCSHLSGMPLEMGCCCDVMPEKR